MRLRAPRQRTRRGPWIVRSVLGSVLALGAIMSSFATATAVTAPSAPPAWQTTWTSPTDLAQGLTANSTVRDVATVAVPGRSLEFTFSNLWSNTATTFSAVTVGVQQSGPDVVPGSIVAVTFHGSRSVTMAPHTQVTSDPVAMAVTAGESLAVSVAVAGPATVSVHFCCFGHVDTYATSNGVGNLTAIPAATKFNPQLTGSWMRWLSQIAVGGSPARGTIVAFGDSITDGYGYLNNGFSWVNAMQARINQLPVSQRMSVVNEGIAGNTMTVFPPHTSYEENSGGLAGVARFQNDALDLAGVKAVVLLLGTNDIWFGAGGVTKKPIPPYGTAPSIEAGMQQVIAMAHARGVKIYGITLLPRSTSTLADHDEPENWTPGEQAILSAVNTWMVSANSGFDGVFNLSVMMSDVYGGACQPILPYAGYFNPDHLHPNVAGETVLADAIPTVPFGMPEAPQVPQLITPTPSPSCPEALLAAQILAAGRQPTPTTTTTTTTTTVPATTTTLAPGLFGGHARTYAKYLLILLLALTVVLLIVSARRSQRRRAHRRRAIRVGTSPRLPPPSSRRPPPPGRRPPPRSSPPRR